jgi:hypothetical protein
MLDKIIVIYLSILSRKTRPTHGFVERTGARHSLITFFFGTEFKFFLSFDGLVLKIKLGSVQIQSIDNPI